MKIKCSTNPAKPMPPDRYEDEDVVDDISLMNLILGQDHSNNSSDSNNSSNSTTQRRTLKRKRETRQSQENLHDFLSSETSFQEDLRGFPSPSEDAHNSSSISLSKTIDVISTATQTLGVKEGESSDCLKSISRALDDFCTIQAEKNKEMQRHHKAMEELQREKIMIKRRSLELQELKYKQEQDKLKRKTCIKCKGD